MMCYTQWWQKQKYNDSDDNFVDATAGKAAPPRCETNNVRYKNVQLNSLHFYIKYLYYCNRTNPFNRRHRQMDALHTHTHTHSVSFSYSQFWSSIYFTYSVAYTWMYIYYMPHLYGMHIQFLLYILWTRSYVWVQQKPTCYLSQCPCCLALPWFFNCFMCSVILPFLFG